MCYPEDAVEVKALKKQLAGLGHHIRTRPAHDAFSKQLCARFEALDANGDGCISKDEINRAIGDRRFEGDAAAMVAVLKKTRDDIEAASDDQWIGEDGITKADVTAYDRRRVEKAGKKSDDDLVERVQEVFAVAKQKIDDAKANDYRLYRRSGAAGGINPFSVRQSWVGNCDFLAALVAFIRQRPADAAKMISAGRNGIYRVKFPGDQRTFTVSKPTDTEIAYLGTSHRDGLWLAVLEKAYGAWVNAGNLITHDNVVDAVDCDPFYEPIITFEGDAREHIKLFTTRSVNVDEIMFTGNETTKERLKDALLRYKTGNQLNKIVVAGIGKFNGPAGAHRPVLRTGHAYAVYAYDEFRDEVSVYDPHGVDCGDRSTGHYTLALDDFCGIFDDVAYEQ